MTFRVDRASARFSDAAPCPEAYRGTYTQHVYCTLPLKEAMTADRTGWFRKLTNHRSAPGGSVADRLDQPCWFVDFDDIDALLAFIYEHGRVVLDSQSDGPELVIYDGYIE